MALCIYNSLTHRKEPFEPQEPGRVGMYVCGVTVYDECHVGHARSAIVFDVIYRYLSSRGLRVTYVRNFTDIDDKILDRARREARPWDEIARTYMMAFRRDMGALGILPPTLEPMATEHIPDMIGMIRALEQKGLAYAVDGNVYFSVSKFPGYGKLSRRDRDQMMAGARVELDERKRDPLDFALWKRSQPGEPAWESPWGHGRPGWHIECSCMSQKYLGHTLDIHGGGLDLVFPHHENEIAQSEALTGKPFARFWIHNGPLTRERVKMSKSLGNILSIREALERYHPEELRLFFLMAHYRKPLDFTEAGMAEAQAALARLYTTLERMERLGIPEQQEEPLMEFLDPNALQGWPEPLRGFRQRFQEAMDDDFNTPRALAGLFELNRALNQWLDDPSFSSGPRLRELLFAARACYGLARHCLGILHLSPGEFQAQKEGLLLGLLGLDRERIEFLIQKRAQARGERNFSEADRIRDDLAARGIQLLDSPQGTSWKIKPGALS
jgi:cysteinyl-tRNA synthetase